MHRLFLLLAVLVATPAHADWWEARTDHFIIYSESSERDAREFAGKLERYDQALRSLQNMEPDEHLSDSRRVTIFRTGDHRDIASLAGNASSGIAGFYIPRASGPVAFVPAHEKISDKNRKLDALTVLFHEYAHHFMFRHFSAAYPSWYVEGLAEAYSTIDFRDDGSFHLGNPPQARGDALFGFFNYSIQRMLLSSNKPDFEDYYGRYSYGWLLTHYLTFEPSRAGQLQTFLKLINAGTDADDAARQAFGDLGKLEKDVNRYKNGRLPGANVRPGNYAPPQVAMRRLGPDEEAIMRVRMRSKVGVNEKSARDVASDARAVAARYPASFAVQLALTEAEFDDRNLDAAEHAADAALAIKPDSVEALLFKGQIYLERAKADPAHIAAARRWLAKAYDADPAHPNVLIQNYLTYLKSGEAIPENAIIGLERAYALAPYDDDLRLILARQLLAEKKGGLTRSVLVPLALSPHESKRAKALNEVVELIEAGKLDDAMTKLGVRIAEEEREKSGDS